ncbi:hypothetical protein EYF80_000133 [Liparis tanakae]|uniref:Uncharacterized protein n=1 Tax=Liparis tanakae TaxID=230148 RepID=A0A4Z2JH83_9TELE|nr:hypothetical protein EYF80_000133 [Liparis tanakae]
MKLMKLIKLMKLWRCGDVEVEGSESSWCSSISYTTINPNSGTRNSLEEFQRCMQSRLRFVPAYLQALTPSCHRYTSAWGIRILISKQEQDVEGQMDRRIIPPLLTDGWD